MYPLLRHLRIVEGASFIAAPSCALHLLQLGAQVIRFDDLNRAPDRGRWPLSLSGHSLYWEGLNKGKKSVALDLSRPQGRELAIAIVTAPGPDAGLFVTNYPADSFLAHSRLAERRADLVTIRVMGWSNGRQAVDYTVNSELGVPLMTGPTSLAGAPVNHVLPAWDLLTGAYAAFALLAAEGHRRATGAGQEVRVPLGDVAMTALGHLGQVAEASTLGRDRPRMGNDLFGAFGRDFATKDGSRIMLVAITARQWTALVEALAIGEAVTGLEAEAGVSFAKDEGQRFLHRDRLFPLVEAAVSARDHATLAEALDRAGACWSSYGTLTNSLAGGLFGMTPGLFADIEHPSGETYPTPGAAATFGAMPRQSPVRAPRLGEHSEEVLADLVGLSQTEIGKLVDDGVVGIADPGKASP